MSIYHLHIPRTSGAFIRESITPAFKSSNIKFVASNRSAISENDLREAEFVSGHYGKTPLLYLKNPTTFTIIRHPVERWTSYIKYVTPLKEEMRGRLERLEEWLWGEQSTVQSNLQTKFLTGYMNIDNFNKNIDNVRTRVDNAWFIENFSINAQDAIGFLNEIKFYSLENQDLLVTDIRDMLAKRYNLSVLQRNFKTNESVDMGIKFSKEIVSRIEQLNTIDMEVYEYVKTKEKR